MRRIVCAALAVVGITAVPGLIVTPRASSTWQHQVDAVIGWEGQDMPGGVHRYTLTPNVSLTIAGVRTKPNLALDGYAAFKQEGSSWLLAAELAAPESRIDAVVDAIDAQGLHTTAVHNHLLHETPRTKYVHLTAVGDAVTMARKLKTVIAQTGWPLMTDE